MTAAPIEAPVVPAPKPRKKAQLQASVKRADLLEAVLFACQSLPTRPPLPVLAGIKLNTERGKLIVSSFDYETSAQTAIQGTDIKVSEVLVSGRLFLDIIKTVDSDTVTLKADDRIVTITAGSDKWTVQALPIEDYPTLPATPEHVVATIPVADFVDAVLTVSAACGRDDTLPVLTGMRMEVEGPQVTFAATDRYRLAIRELDTGADLEVSEAYLPVGRSLVTVAKWFKKAKRTGNVIIHATRGVRGGENLLCLQQAGFRYTLRTLDGEYPKYRALLGETSGEFAFDTKDALASVKKAAVTADRNTPVRFTVGGGAVYIEAGCGDEAQARIPLKSAEVDKSEVLVIAFNPDFFAEGVKAVGGQTASVAYTTANKPGYLIGESGTKYLIMPVRLSG